MRRGSRRPVAWYSLLLRAYPRAFRERFAAEMSADFRALLEAHRRRAGWRGARAAWRRALVDLAASVPREWRAELASLRRERHGRAGLGAGLIQDLRYGIRGLARAPGFAAAATLTLALGIGAASAIFSVVHGVLLEPLPFPEPDRLLMVTRDGGVSIPDGVDWRSQSRTLEDVALFLRTWDFDLTGEGAPRRIGGSVVEPRLFDLLGVKPVAGRLLTAADDQLGGARVAVISHGLWQRLGGGPEVIGRTLTLSDRMTTVVGVAPPELDVFGDGVEVWVPVSVETPWALADRGSNNFDALARLAPRVSLEQARTELRLISERLLDEYPTTNRGKIVVPISLLDFLVGRVRRALWVLLAAVGFLLALASANLAGLLIARSARREEEFAVRIALGAGRVRVARQLVTEGLCLALAGGLLGAVFAYWARAGLTAVAPASLPRIGSVAVDARVLGFALLAALASGLAFSLVPALQVARSDASGFLSGARSAGSGRRRLRLRALLVSGEIALASLLLVGSGLLVRSVQELGATRAGFDPQRLLTAAVSLPEARYADFDRQTETLYRIVERVEALVEVESAATVIGLPLESWGRVGHSVFFDDRPPVEPGQEPGARSRPVAGHYFRTLRIPILAGRAFGVGDHAGGDPVAIVNETAARRFWPEGSPLGKRVAWRYGGLEPRWMRVVGVCGDTRSASLVERDVPAIYSPYAQRIVEWQRFASLAVRTRVEPRAALGAVEQAVWSVDPTLPLARVATMDERLAAAVAQDRFNALLLAFFAAMAVLIAVQGLYASLAYAVEQRRREIGVRVALGAARTHVLRLVVGGGLRVALAGLALGLPLAAVLAGYVASLLHGVAPRDPATYAVAAALLLATTAAACLVPAARAARLDPAVSLRED